MTIVAPSSIRTAASVLLALYVVLLAGLTLRPVSEDTNQTLRVNRLPKREAGDVRRLVRALEREGVRDAEALVRRSRGRDEPILAAAVIERRLEELVNAQPEGQREQARALIRHAAQILTQQGSATSPPLPGWATVEVADGAKAARPIRLR